MMACGVDVESCSRVARLCRQGKMPLGLFSAREQARFGHAQIVLQAFTAKEAALKALGSGWFNTELDPHHIELSFAQDGQVQGVQFAAIDRLQAARQAYCELQFQPQPDALLAVVTLSPAANLRKSVVVYPRSSNITTKQSGQLAARCAVEQLLQGHLTDGQHFYYDPHFYYDKKGAPRWHHPHLPKVALSITHNSSYACAAAVCN